MGFRKGAYAKIWSVEDKGNVTKVNLSTSKKDKTGEYVTDFSGFVNLVGTAHQNAGSLSSGGRIKIGDCDVTTSFNKDTKTGYTNYAIFTFESADSTESQSAAHPPKKSEAKPTKKAATEESEDGEEEDLPF